MSDGPKQVSRLKGAFARLKLADPDKGLIEAFTKLTRGEGGNAKRSGKGKATRKSD